MLLEAPFGTLQRYFICYGPGTKEKLECTHCKAVAVYDMRFGPATASVSAMDAPFDTVDQLLPGH